MGAGGQPVGRGYWKNAMANTPAEALNRRLAFSVLCFGMMVRRIKFSPPSPETNGEY